MNNNPKSETVYFSETNFQLSGKIASFVHLIWVGTKAKVAETEISKKSSFLKVSFSDFSVSATCLFSRFCFFSSQLLTAPVLFPRVLFNNFIRVVVIIPQRTLV